MDFLLTDAEQALQKRVRKLAQEKIAPIATKCDESYELCWDLIKLLAENDIFRYVVPEDYGGLGISSTNICIIREELSAVCNAADEIFAMQGLGSYPISCFGTEAQKRQYLPDVANGKKLISFCLSESVAGSDVANIRTTAYLEKDQWVLNGEKCYVSKPEDANLFTVFAKTNPDKGAKGMSAFILEKGQSGVRGISEQFIIPCPIGKIVLENCQVPKDQILGEVGQGMKIALNNLTLFRKTVGASALGFARAAFEQAIRHARKRELFEQKLMDFQITQFKLADMATQLEAATLLVYKAAWMSDHVAKDSRKESSMAKLYATEVAQSIIDEAVQVLGGLGVKKDQRVEFLYRCIRITRIIEGTSEVQKLTIARELFKDQLYT